MQQGVASAFGDEMQSSQADLERLIGTSLSKGHRKVAAQRTLMLLYRYQEAPEAYLASMSEVLARCRPSEAARMRRASIAWARVFRGW